MCHYKHLTPFERERILFFLIRGESITKIARLLNRSKSTISREIRRNAASADSSMPYYLPFEAQMLYVQRRKACSHISAWTTHRCELTSRPVS